MRMPAMRARTQYEYGRMLVQCQSSADARRGALLLVAALETAESLGLCVLEKRLHALLQTRSAASARSEMAPEPACNLFRRDGNHWAIAFEGEAFRLRHTKGLAYLAELIHNPTREFLALDLARSAKEHSGVHSRGRDAGVAVSRHLGDAGPLLDGQAKAEYRRRLEDLREQLDEATRFRNPDLAAQARSEIEFLTRELLRATGLGGRDRRAASAVERARASVTIAIRAMLKRISEHSPALGHHLAATVKTGKFCSYALDGRSASAWTP
jgi:hypothetical protein